MSWGNPWMLLALLLPAGGLWLLRRRDATVRPPPPALHHVLITGDNSIRPAGRQRACGRYLLGSAIALGVLALARPQWGSHVEPSFSQSVEVLIALDLSRSMWAQDMPGRHARLAAAKDVVGKLLDALKGENVGLIVFAGSAFVQVPMSPDYQIIREFLPSLDPDYMPLGGSDYNRMLDSALQGFSREEDRDRYLLVLSDGESSTQGWEQKLPDLRRRGIHVVGIGFGTEHGAFIPNPKGTYLTDSSGATVISRLTAVTLRGLARGTGGRYLNATSLQGAREVSELLRATVETGRAARAARTDANVINERFQWLLLPAVLLGLAGLIREMPRDVRTRQIRRPHLTALAVVGILLCTQGARSDPRSSDQAVESAVSSDPAQRVRTLAARFGQSGYDASDLELFVVASIQYGASARSQGRLPLKGAIRDAIDATREGRRLAPQGMSWGGYEAQLRSLMEPLPGGFREHDTQQSDEDDSTDHKNDDPMAAGRKKAGKNGPQVKTDGAVSRSDFTLGDLSADDNFAPRPSPMKKPPAAQALRRTPRSLMANPDDPGLVQARSNSAAVVRADSPGRVHLLLEGAKANKAPGRDW